MRSGHKDQFCCPCDSHGYLWCTATARSAVFTFYRWYAKVTEKSNFILIVIDGSIFSKSFCAFEIWSWVVCEHKILERLPQLPWMDAHSLGATFKRWMAWPCNLMKSWFEITSCLSASHVTCATPPLSWTKGKCGRKIGIAVSSLWETA